jgi:hypothetical protein
MQASSGYAQNLPKVFLVGENEKSYEKMMGDYTELLLTVSENSMDTAYNHWISMLTEMEAYSDQMDYDIKGVKIWLNVFWHKSGNIDYLVYYPKPNSRNIDFDKFTEFLTEFISMYKLDIDSNSNFSHYGSASFPTLGKRNTDKG